MKNILSVLIVLICLSTAAVAQNEKKAKVFVLSALHQLHGQTEFYSFDKLSQTIEKFDPDIIAVELTPSDLQSRKEQKTKQEYQKSIFPLADKHKYKLVPMEPAEPKFSELLKLYSESNREFKEKSPQKAEAFSTFNENLYEYLLRTWNSPLAVNSSETDALFEVKHKYQIALFGEKEEQVWESWNRHFLEKILETAEKNPGKKILVVVGVEHSYWLRKHLRENQTVILLKPEEVLK